MKSIGAITPFMFLDIIPHTHQLCWLLEVQYGAGYQQDEWFQGQPLKVCHYLLSLPFLPILIIFHTVGKHWKGAIYTVAVAVSRAP